MRSPRKKALDDEPEGIVYRVPGPGGEGEMWIAESVTGHAAHGRTPEAAVQGLQAGLEALAAAAGQTLLEWRKSQAASSIRFLRRSELLQT